MGTQENQNAENLKWEEDCGGWNFIFDTEIL